MSLNRQGDAEGLLATADVDPANDLPSAVDIGDLVFERAGENHPAKRLGERAGEFGFHTQGLRGEFGHSYTAV